MKRLTKSMLGVTLLEIMLVLAVAAMIIVMSVRYYQSASASQQSNSLLEQIQAITAAADGIAQGSNTYANLSTAQVQPMMPNQSMNDTWGGAITVKGTGATTYTVTIPGVPQNVCAPVIASLAANAKYTALKPATSSACTGTSITITYTYNSQG